MNFRLTGVCVCVWGSVSSKRASRHDDRWYPGLADIRLFDDPVRVGPRLPWALCTALSRQRSQLVREVQGTIRMASDWPRCCIQGHRMLILTFMASLQ